MTNCKYKLRKLSVGLVSVGTMLIAPTVLGQEVSANTETSTTSTASTSTDTASGTAATTPSASTSTGGAAASGASGEATVATANGGPQSAPATSEATPQPQAQTATVAATSASSTSSSSEEKTPKVATSSTSPSTPVAVSSSSNSNQVTGAEAETPMMEVEQYTVDKEKTELTVKDGNKLNSSGSDKQLIRNRDGEQRDIFDIKREVKTNADGTIDVTVTVTPKEIDKGADVMALLDVSKKMTEDDFNNAKDKIKKLVTTLTSKSADGQQNLNNRNRVRLMTFYREISDPIDISGKTETQLDQLLNELREKAKADYDWGVDLQGAIHKAREIFKRDQEKKSGKRQHIVLFSQGESTFSYDIKNKNDSKLKKARLTTVTTSNPLFSWFPIFDHTNRKADMLDDFDKLLSIAQKFGVEIPNGLKTGLKAAATTNSLLSSFTGGDGLTDYLTLREYMADKLQETDFNYSNRVGEGYHHHSFSERNTHDMPMKETLEKLLDSQIPRLDKESWFGWALDKLSLTETYQNGQKVALMKILDYLFYKREYVYYNHNLSAIAEAKMAQQEGITFYSVDVTDFETTSKRVKRQVGVLQETAKKEPEKERNDKFDKYLKDMSEGKKFLKDIDNQDKFKDILTDVTVTETFEGQVAAGSDSWSNSHGVVKYQKNENGGWFTTSKKESLTWTISKEQLKKAFEDGKPLTFTYKLKVEKDKFKTALEENKKQRTKRSAPTENENSVTKKIISNTVTYKINNQEVKDNNLDEVNLTYSKLKVPVPQIDGQVIEPQAPKLPELPPVTERGPVLDYTEESIYRLPLEHGSNAPDTQVTIEEDTVPQRPDILVGGQSGPVDITEDTQPGMSGSNDATVVEEDTTPKRPDVLVGGQSDPIDITEDTQPSVSGSNDATVVEEDTAPKRPDILVGGQSDPIDITEDTQPGMSGSNDATVIEEDTKPKRFFHFDNELQAPEKPKEQPSLSLPQAPVYKAAHHLPASGDKREASFTIAALTIIGAAGLLSKKRRDTEEN
ncbi:TPA: fibronectin binding protein [Streptococcus pyogenes]|uniref:serum opacification factor n=1 Tax=Streptococcus pyogenes TaxID=1314 RepID=UPI000DA37C66|nr:serum opacification factor [Streptococcus pyogenes]SQF33401.1 serum opacity factor Sof [Streptococcus pyogenes]HEQ7791162.1 fibronectin binding protein [Streptococcus pyogenes]HER1104817.1 fibronectin binding protein [Streptococcus pyogenes]HER1214503.1 fibronectin binding protein [Streptococcus pyogenes]HER1357215.1 fibronectin binding protein [Streptococcus pyogenes]